MARHFPIVADAATLPTRPFQLVQRAVPELVEMRWMGAVYGDTGLGKTFSVEYAINRITDVPVVWVQFPLGVKIKDVISELLEAVTGVPHDDVLRRLGRALRAVLASTPRLIVVDEAQHLNTETIEYLRYLWDAPETSFGILFVGGNGCWEVLAREPMLRTRISRQVEFKRLTDRQVLELAPKYHRIYAKASREDLLLINDRFARGLFRNWGIFTNDAACFCDDLGRETVDTEIIQNVFALHGGAHDKR
jgi:type II secretory pathway predicted ATPase ExeA